MIHKIYNIPIFDFTLNIIQLQGKETLSEIDEKLEDLDIKGDEICFINPNLVDGGHTLTNERKKTIVVFFHAFTSEEERIKIYGHEKRHIVDRLCLCLNIQDLESAALLSGYIEQIFYIHFDKSIKN